ncbi:MAG: flagellar biosynthetic protein FliR, partial [bacterium]
MVAFSDAQLQAWMAAFLLPFFRILALFTAAPVLSLRTIPARARIGLSVVLAATIAPSVAAPVQVDLMSYAGLGFVAQEVAVGLALGLLIALPFLALILFVNLLLGVMSRVAPQLSLFSIGFPVTICAGL